VYPRAIFEEIALFAELGHTPTITRGDYAPV
jgi:hypothetical protein